MTYASKYCQQKGLQNRTQFPKQVIRTDEYHDPAGCRGQRRRFGSWAGLGFVVLMCGEWYRFHRGRSAHE